MLVLTKFIPEAIAQRAVLKRIKWPGRFLRQGVQIIWHYIFLMAKWQEKKKG
jgi:hypothetical protein